MQVNINLLIHLEDTGFRGGNKENWNIQQCSVVRLTQAGVTLDKILAVVTDNGANMVAAVHKAEWAHYPCFAHTLNLVVKKTP